MKRILLGLLVTGTVAGVATLATNAFFTDTATSTGDTLQAGNLKLQVKSDCSYDGIASASGCGTFDYTNGVLDKFFNFQDVKPGDYGENTISFEVLNNPAWMCANLAFSPVGDIANYLQVFWWVDSDGDNVYQNSESILYPTGDILSELSMTG